jgi:Mg2+-importing ATPase
MYFVTIALLQACTHPLVNMLPADWSPTGYWSTAVPLVLCFLLECLIDITGHLRDIRFVRAFNARTHVLLDGRQIANEHLHPGEVIRVAPGEVVDADLIILRATSLDDAPVRISLANINGESRAVMIQPALLELGAEVHVTENNRELLHNFRGTLNNVPFDHTSLMVNGARLVSRTSVLGLVVACGADRKCVSNNTLSIKKPNSIDEWVSLKMMRASMVCLVAMVWVLWYANGTPPVKAVIVLNGVFPFSVRILLAVVRVFQQRDMHGVHAVHAVDEISQIDWLVCDKTGTLTSNAMKMVCTATGDDNVSTDLRLTDAVLRMALPHVVCRTLLGTPETEEDELIAAVCAEHGWPSRGTLLPTTNLHFHQTRPISTQVFKTGTGTYRLFCKASPATLYGLLCPTQRARFDSAEKAMMRYDPSLRVLAVGMREIPCDLPIADFTQAEKEFLFVGLIGLRDDAIEGVEHVLKMYRNVAILTGDRRATALALANRLGLPSTNNETILLAGTETLDELPAGIRTIIGYGMTPDAKQKVVDRLQTCFGKKCMAVGDGLNDVGMIRTARVGVAIGKHVPTPDVRLTSILHLPALIHRSEEMYTRNRWLALFVMWKCLSVTAALFFVLSSFAGKPELLFDLVIHQGFHIGWSGVHAFLFGVTSLPYCSQFSQPFHRIMNGFPRTRVVTVCAIVATFLTVSTVQTLLSSVNGEVLTQAYLVLALAAQINLPLCVLDRAKWPRVFVAQSMSAALLLLWLRM